MGIFDRFPYSSTHEMNLDFMLGKATEIAESLQEIDTHKEQAEQAATNAAQSAQSAAQAAQAAAGSQTAAGTSASQAAQHKADAEDAADRAEAASNLADEAVEQAQTAAQNASTAADGAIASANAAETRINNLAASLPADFTELNNEVRNAMFGAFKPSEFHNMGISASTGAKAANNARLCNIAFFDPVGNPVTFYTRSGYKLYLCGYTKNGVYQGYVKSDGTFTKVAAETSPLTSCSITEQNAALYKYYIILIREDNGNISASESNNLCLSIGNLSSVVKKSAYINVVNYSAVGDGVTDDAPAIQNAFNACNNAGGGIVYFPAGTYRINNQLIFYSNMKIIMAEGAVILRGAEKNGIYYSHCTNSTLEYNGVHDVVFEGGILDLGTNIAQGGLGIGIIHGYNITIRNMTFKHVNKGYHSLDICCCKNVTVENCIFTDMLTDTDYGECIQIDSADSKTSFPSPELTQGAATFDSTPTVNVNIYGCKFDLDSYSPAIGNHNDILSKNIFFHDNVISGTAGSRGAVAFDHYTQYYQNPNETTEVFIHHNIFEGCTYGFKFDVGGTGKVYIRDNIFKDIGTLKINPTSNVGEFLNNIELT